MAEMDLESVSASLHTKLAILEAFVENTPAGAPAKCNCGRDLKSHYQDMLDAVQALIDIVDNDDPTALTGHLAEKGERYLSKFVLEIIEDPIMLKVIITKYDELIGGPALRRKANYLWN